MAGRYRGWRAWLAAAMSIGLAGTGTIILGPSPVSGIFLPAASCTGERTRLVKINGRWSRWP
jgi:hypothetical protein